MDQQPPLESNAGPSIADQLGQVIGSDKQPSDDLSQAFERAMTHEPNVRELHATQMRTRTELEDLQRLVRSLKRQLLVWCVVLIMLVIGVASAQVLIVQNLVKKELAAVAGSLDVARQPTNNSGGTVANGLSSDPTGATAMPFGSAGSLPLVETIQPLSPADRDFYPRLLDLYSRARDLRQVQHSPTVERTAVRSDQYARLLTDATKFAEYGASNGVSTESLELIVKITQLAKLFSGDVGTLDEETERLNDEVAAAFVQLRLRASLVAQP